VADIVFTWDQDLPDGVYLGLSHLRYFGQRAMGSSDWIKLDQRGLGWWWSSHFNRRRRVPKSTKAQLYGSALHVIVLEGVEAYERTFAIEPARQDYEGLVDTIDEMREALGEAGFVVPPKGRLDKAGWAGLMLDMAPEVPCWHNIMEEFAAQAGERERIDATEDYELRFLREMAISPDRNDNEEVRRLLADNEDHPPLAEVSVFATINGVRRRWRFDRLFPGVTMDLKSLGAWAGRPLEWEAGDVMAKRRWSIQRADYDIGRAMAYDLIRAGKLFGGTLEQRRYLERLVEENPTWDWLWCVYEKPDSVRGTAPVFMPIWDDQWSDLHNAGQAKLDNAIRLYRHAVAAYGLDEPWGRVERLHYTNERPGRGGATLPRVFIPAYAFDTDAPAEAGAYEKEEAGAP